MMKVLWMVIVLAGVSLSGFAEVSKDRLRDLERLIKINAVRDFEDGHRADKKLMLRVEFSSANEGLDDMLIRIAVEMTDRKTKQPYLAEEAGGFGNMPANYEGKGVWELTIPYEEFEKLKMTAYVIEIGVLDGDTFVPVLAECDHAESYEELAGRTAMQKFPNRCKLSSVVMVDGY